MAYIKSFPVGRENSRIYLVKNPPYTAYVMKISIVSLLGSDSLRHV